MLFITVRSASPADVPRVLQVVEQIRRLRHKRGTYPTIYPSPHFPLTHLPFIEVNAGALREELNQYVVYDAQPRAPQRIRLDDPPANTYTPPTSLTVHLSKIPMPELCPPPVPPKGHQHQHNQQQPSPTRPHTFPMPRSGSGSGSGPAPPPPPLHRAPSPPRNVLRSSPLSASPPQQQTVFSTAQTPPSPHPTPTHQHSWHGSLWGRSRKSMKF